MKKKEEPDVYALAPEPEVKRVGPRAAILALIALCLVMAAMSHFTNRQLKQAEQHEPPIPTPPPIDPEQLRLVQRSAVGLQAPSFGQEAAGAIGRDLAQVTERVLERNLEVRPTLEIRSGFLLHVVLTEDYFFERPTFR